MIHVKGEAGRAVAWLETTLRFLTSETRSGRPGVQMVVDRLPDVLFVQVVRAAMEERPAGEGGWTWRRRLAEG